MKISPVGLFRTGYLACRAESRSTPANPFATGTNALTYVIHQVGRLKNGRFSALLPRTSLSILYINYIIITTTNDPL